ncbi:hypothetical protein P4B35_01985 [Pontiellaceae bacterium B12227]|nr:hypothetical protein [Pontiellaceae bacterium B12227]
MKKKILLIPIALCITGCLNPKLCGIEDHLNKDHIQPEYLEYFKDKPTPSVAEAHGTLLPLLHVREQLQKQPDGFRFVNYVSFLGGLLFEGGTTRHFDEEGIPQWNEHHSASLNILYGMLFESDIDEHMNNSTGSVKKSFLFRAFGSAQEVGGTKYYTILWMPMKFSNKATEPEK